MQNIIWSHCNNCGRSTQHDMIADRDRSHDDWIDKYEMLECRGCGAISMRNVYGLESLKPRIVIYPPAIARRKPGWADWYENAVRGVDIPDDVVELLEEIYTSVQNGSPRLAAMGIRALLETMMTQKVGDRGTFKGNVDALVAAGYVSMRQALTVQSILDAGHASIHRSWKPTDQDISTLLDISENIMETFYLHEDLVKELDRKVPKRTRPHRGSNG